MMTRQRLSPQQTREGRDKLQELCGFQATVAQVIANSIPEVALGARFRAAAGLDKLPELSDVYINSCSTATVSALASKQGLGAAVRLDLLLITSRYAAQVPWLFVLTLE